MNKKKLIIKGIIIGILIILFIILSIIKAIPEWAEFYALNIASNIIVFMSIITSIFPFSLYEWTFILLVGLALFYIITTIIKLCKKKYHNSLQRFLSFLIAIFVFTNAYMATASISYGREQVNITLYQDEVNETLIDETFEYFLNDYNSLAEKFERNEDGTIISPYTFEEINDLLIKEYEKLNQNSFSSFTPRVKQLTFSPIFSELHFTGVFFAPLGEASINKDMKAVELPHTMAHEIAHAKGIFREDDANLLAMYITLTSDNDYLRYSSYYHNFFYLLRMYSQIDNQKYQENVSKINPLIYKEINTINKFWSEHDLLSKIGNFFNDLFLKLNGNEDGVNDYVDTSNNTDSGITDEDDKPIYIITSTYVKLFIQEYLNQKNEVK